MLQCAVNSGSATLTLQRGSDEEAEVYRLSVDGRERERVAASFGEYFLSEVRQRLKWT